MRAKGLNSHFSKAEIEMTNKYVGHILGIYLSPYNLSVYFSFKIF